MKKKKITNENVEIGRIPTEADRKTIFYQKNRKINEMRF